MKRAHYIKSLVVAEDGGAGFDAFLHDVTSKLSPMGRIALQQKGAETLKAAYAAMSQDPEARERYISNVVSRMETKAKSHD